MVKLFLSFAARLLQLLICGREVLHHSRMCRYKSAFLLIENRYQTDRSALFNHCPYTLTSSAGSIRFSFIEEKILEVGRGSNNS